MTQLLAGAHHLDFTSVAIFLEAMAPPEIQHFPTWPAASAE